MITLAASGDSHFDTTSRWDECLRIHNWMADDFTDRGVDVFVHPGDWFERGSKPEERNAVRAWLQKVAQYRPVVGVRGNHDSLGDLEIFNHISAPEPIIVEEMAAVHIVKPKHLPDHPGIAIAALAWPRKTQLLARLGREVGKEESEGAVRQVLRNIMLGLRQQLHAHPGPRVLVMHAMVNGSVTSTGQPLVGCDLEVTLTELALAEPDIVLLSHVHKPQDWFYNGIPIIYCGSPYATAYGEIEDKSYALVTFEDERNSAGKILKISPEAPQGWQRIKTPRTPMVLINAVYRPETNDFYYTDELAFDYAMAAGADVRFRYSFAKEYRDAALRASKRVEQDLATNGAVKVKIEDVQTETSHARAPEIVKEKKIIDKLPILWTAQGLEISPERQARLLGKAQEIENEVRETL
jgi:DNA repair exonuclease SbcCD nuclease subunit